MPRLAVVKYDNYYREDRQNEVPAIHGDVSDAEEIQKYLFGVTSETCAVTHSIPVLYNIDA